MGRFDGLVIQPNRIVSLQAAQQRTVLRPDHKAMTGSNCFVVQHHVTSRIAAYDQYRIDRRHLADGGIILEFERRLLSRYKPGVLSQLYSKAAFADGQLVAIGEPSPANPTAVERRAARSAEVAEISRVTQQNDGGMGRVGSVRREGHFAVSAGSQNRQGLFEVHQPVGRSGFQPAQPNLRLPLGSQLMLNCHVPAPLAALTPWNASISGSPHRLYHRLDKAFPIKQQAVSSG